MLPGLKVGEYQGLFALKTQYNKFWLNDLLKMMQQFQRTIKFCVSGFLLALLTVMNVYAVTYSAGLENSEWHTKNSKLECLLWQPIPKFGRGVFIHRAGNELQFYLKVDHNTLAPGSAVLTSGGAVWKPRIDSKKMTEVTVVDSTTPVTVKAPYAGLMLANLTQGIISTISTQSDVALGALAVKVAISTVNFSDAYRDYVQCVKNLLPVSYQDISRSSVFYTVGKKKLSGDDKERLDLIVRYVTADKRVTKIVVDGHADSAGDKKMSFDTSKKQADLVVAYFKKKGISSKRMMMRWHGDRYPLINNKDMDGHARNRRVTVRLDRE